MRELNEKMIKQKLSISILFAICVSFVLAQNCNCYHSIAASQTYIDGATMNIRPGDTIYLEAGNKSYLRLVNFHGDANKKIVFINRGGEVKIQNTSNPYGIKLGNCSYFRFTGTGVSSIKYGIKSFGSTGNGISLDDKSTNFEVDHIEVGNSGFAGIVAKSDPNCDSTTIRGRFVQYQTILHDNYVHDTAGEGFYIGHSYYTGYPTTCNGISCTLFPHILVGVRIYNNIVENTHWDGIQVGCATDDCEIYGNRVTNYGVDALSTQNSGIQISGGTTGKCYNNYVANGTGNGIFVMGLGNNDIFNNVIVNAGYNYYPSDPVKRVHGILCDDRTTIQGRSFNFYNNTIVSPKTDGIRFMSTQSVNNKFYNNLILKPGSLGSYNQYSKENSYINVGSKSGISAILSNNYFDTNMVAVQFADSAANDFRINANSSVIDAGLDLSTYGVNFDFNNALRPVGKSFDIGAFERQIVSGIDDISDISRFVFLYPNPCAGQFNIIFSNANYSTYRIIFYNVQGKDVLTMERNVGDTTVDLHDKIAKGIYLVKIFVGYKMFMTKLVIR